MNHKITGDNQFSSKQDKSQAQGDGRKSVKYVEKDQEGKKKSEQNISSKKKVQKTQQQSQDDSFISIQPPPKVNKSKKKPVQKQICGMNFKCGHQCKSDTHKVDKPHNKDCNNCQQQNQNKQNFQFIQKNCDHVFQCGHNCTSDKEKHGHNQYCQLCLEQRQRQNKLRKQQKEKFKQQQRQQQQPIIVKIYQCTKQLDCRHQCDKIHQLQCPPCRVNITKQFPCGHMQEYECYQSQNQQKCTMTLSQKLNCGHLYQYQCSNKPQIYICYSKCHFKLSCGHQCQAQCGYCPQDFHDPCVKKIQPLQLNHFCIKENISKILTFQENIQFHQKYCRIYGIDFQIFSDAYRREVEIEIVIFQMAFKNKIQQLQVQDMMLYTNKLLELVKRKDLYLQLNTSQFNSIKLVLCKLILSHMKNKIADNVLAQCNQIKYQFESNDVDKILRFFLNLTECIQPQLCSHPCSIRDFHLTGCSCNQKLNYYRNCGHYIQTQCMSVELYKIEKYLPACDQICNKQMVCGHKCQLKCYLKCICQENKIIQFRGCNHSKQMQCKLITNTEVCQEQVQVQLKCLHLRQTICSQKDIVQCDQTIIHTCQNCKKKREIMCKDYDNYQCLVQKQCQNCKKVLNVQCDQFGSCLCFQKVYEQQEQLVADKTCYQILDCGHRCAGILCLPKLHEYCKSKNKCQCGQLKYCNRGLCDKCNNLNPYPVRNLHDQLAKLEKYGLGSLSNLIIKKQYTDFDIKNLQIQIQIIIQIHELPQLDNRKYIQVIFFLKYITQDSELVCKINQSNMEKLQLTTMNLQAYAKQDQKSFINVSKYLNMKKIENKDFQLTRQQLHDL